MSQSEKSYRCLYNHEMLILFTTETPYQTYRENVTENQVKGYVRELADTQVDALMCCPTAWRAVLWPSQVDPRWQEEAPGQVEPLPEGDWKYYDKVYWRVRRYMLQGNDPLQVTLNTAREIGIDFFISYRMNDRHYLNQRQCPTHDSFWRNNPGYWIDPTRGSGGNYLIPQVRRRYLDLLTELSERYEADGLELDFQRSPPFFPPDKVDQGRPIMTEFVRDIRNMLTRIGEQRNKKLQLSVRVPYTIDRCLQVGLDPVAWDRDGLIDMVNVSPFFRNTAEIDIEGFKQQITNARVYGELNFNTQGGALPSGYNNNVMRLTTPEQYETTAYAFWKRGADGVSFFNFAYSREHSFHEPRRRELPGLEPPFHVLKHVCDLDYLSSRPKHYCLTPGFGSLPIDLPPGRARSVELHIVDNVTPGTIFNSAMLRIEMTDDCWRIPFQVQVNGKSLQPSNFVGELFTPFSLQALPDMRQVRHFQLPLALLQTGQNRITVRNLSDEVFSNGVPLTWQRLEIALYTDKH